MVAPGPDEAVVFDLLILAKMEGWQEQLLQALSDERDQKPQFQDLVKRFLAQETMARRAAVAPRPQRRWMTIMACQIVERSKLAADIEAESIVLNGLNELLAQKVRQWSGFVYRSFFYDPGIVCFEYPRALEDGPEWAARCGLGIQRARRDVAPGLLLRIGIHRGEILIESIAEPAGVRLGGAIPDIATRICAEAEPDTVLVSGEIEAATRDLFEFQSRHELGLNDGERPLLTYRALSERQLSITDARERLEPLQPMVGRQEELKLLSARWLEACGTTLRSGHRVIVSVEGEPAVGKTRLVTEFGRSLRNTVMWSCFLYCSEVTGNTPYSSIRDGIRRLAKIAEADASSRATEKLHELLGKAAVSWPEQRAAAFFLAEVEQVAPPLPVDAQDLKRLLIQTGVRIFLGLAGDCPILLCLDDAQWLDPSSKAVLEAILSRVGSRLMLVMTIRSGYEIPFRCDSAIKLMNLSAEQGEQLARQIAGSAVMPERMIERIVETAEGNPLYIKHLTYALANMASAGQSTVEDLEKAIKGVRDPLAASLFARLGEIGDAGAVARRHRWRPSAASSTAGYCSRSPRRPRRPSMPRLNSSGRRISCAPMARRRIINSSSTIFGCAEPSTNR